MEYQGRQQKKFQGGGQWMNQDREIVPASLYFISGGLGGALDIHPGLTSKERCIKSPE